MDFITWIPNAWTCPFCFRLVCFFETTILLGYICQVMKKHRKTCMLVLQRILLKQFVQLLKMLNRNMPLLSSFWPNCRVSWISLATETVSSREKISIFSTCLYESLVLFLILEILLMQLSAKAVNVLAHAAKTALWMVLLALFASFAAAKQQK